MPLLTRGEGHEILRLTTGGFTARGGNGVLTHEREQELMWLRDHGYLGTLQDFNNFASCLPQDTRVWYFFHAEEPDGYDETVYGTWPEVGVWVLKARYPPSFHTVRTAGNWHTVTFLISRGQNPSNHLDLGEKLRPIVGTHCTCKSGSSTNSQCMHRAAFAIALMAPSCFNPIKMKSARLVDPYRPYSHQPQSSGPPLNTENRELLLQQRANPPHHGNNRRRNTRDSLVEDYGNGAQVVDDLTAGYPQDMGTLALEERSEHQDQFWLPPQCAANRKRQKQVRGKDESKKRVVEGEQECGEGGREEECGEEERREGQSLNLPGTMSNPANSCFAASAISLVEATQIDLHLDPGDATLCCARGSHAKEAP